MTGFTQRVPFDGQPASERTEVRVIFDDEALYVGVWAFDSQADAITYGERIRDYEVNQSDAIVFVLDTYNDDQNGFVFGTTPTGIEYDGQVANEGSRRRPLPVGAASTRGGASNRDRAAASTRTGTAAGRWRRPPTARGWYAEFRIPFNTLRYGANSDTWGFNVIRRIRRLNEEAFWTPVPREFNLYRLNYAGDLEGLRPPFRRLATVTPYVLGSTGRRLHRGDELFAGREPRRRGQAAGHAGPHARRDVQHRLRPGRGGRPAAQSDAVFAELPREAALLPRKRRVLQCGRRGRRPLLQPQDRGSRAARPVPITGGAAAVRPGRGAERGGSCTSRPAGRRGCRTRTATPVARLARELPNRSRVGGPSSSTRAARTATSTAPTLRMSPSESARLSPSAASSQPPTTRRIRADGLTRGTCPATGAAGPGRSRGQPARSARASTPRSGSCRGGGYRLLPVLRHAQSPPVVAARDSSARLVLYLIAAARPASSRASSSPPACTSTRTGNGRRAPRSTPAPTSTSRASTSPSRSSAPTW